MNNKANYGNLLVRYELIKEVVMLLRRELEKLISKVIAYKGDCAFKEISATDMSQLTVKQIEYLKVIDDLEATTISNLAEILELAKPTVTESVKRLQKLNCVEKHQCKNDARIQYITLTEKGERIAHLESFSNVKLLDRIVERLSEDELNALIKLLKKIMDET